MSTPGELLEALGREARARFGNGGAGTRTYRGRTVEEIVPRIQRELGDEAIIVRRREGLTGGVLGFFQHPFVEIEAMPGSPGIDVYDEPDSVAPAPAPPPLQPPPPAPVQRPALGYRPAVARPSASPPPPTQPGAVQGPAPGYPPSAEQPPPPTPAARAAPPTAPEPPPAAPKPAAGATPLPPAAGATPLPPAAEQGLAAGYRPAAEPAPPLAPAAAPARAPAPAPFYTREPATPAGAEDSAYVTARLAALARASRAKGAQREPTERRAPRERPPRAPVERPAEFRELVPSEEEELFQPVVERAPPPRVERRTVAPGSHARARAGVSKGLQRYGISEDLAGELIDGATAHALALAPRAGLAHAVRTTLAQRIPVAPPLPTKGAAIVVVGAGGVGKTTCCAALLGAYRKSSSLPASCATITREAERGELRMILSPYVMKPSSPRAPRALSALRRARSEGLALLDTPGLSPSDRAGIRELASLLGELQPERVVVALPATLGATPAAQLLQALAPLGANALAVTHADETDQIGVAVEAAVRFGLAPEYMLERGRAGGWRLRQVDPTSLAEKLLP